MYQKISILFLCLITTSVLYAAHNTLKVKNNTSETIEFKLHAGESQAKMIAPGKSARFSVNMLLLQGLDWQIPSKTNPKCKNWYTLDKKSQTISVLNNQAKNSKLVIEENGGFQSITDKSVQKVESMKPFTEVCSGK